MYDLEIKPEAKRIIAKLVKKNVRLFDILDKKQTDIRQKPFHQYKSLRKPLQNFNRVHIDKHFVLIFRIDHKQQVVEIWHFAHHDTVYGWNP
ncbi:type II toxin-antitoxin system RelE/ParE family toxin [Nanoarchaeota archaeon]